jgi:ubiquinone/menaquinone biosynthesis C-methylase UbiE
MVGLRKGWFHKDYSLRPISRQSSPLGGNRAHSFQYESPSFRINGEAAVTAIKAVCWQSEQSSACLARKGKGAQPRSFPLGINDLPKALIPPKRSTLMPRTGEITYYQQIGESGRRHSIAKPFSDPNCDLFLVRVAEVLRLLPQPPARILECGCGTGWLTYFLAQRGFEMVGTDVCPDAIQIARDNPTFQQGPVPEFVVADAEQLSYDAEFDAVLFFDSLHHAVDELAAVRSAYKALRPGGVCVLVEPGWGHHRRSLDVEEQYGVTEKDMPPYYVKKLARQAGFTGCRVYPKLDHVSKALYPAPNTGWSWGWRLLTSGPAKYLAIMALLVGKGLCGVTVLSKAHQ